MNDIKIQRPVSVDRSEEFAKLVIDRHPEYVEMFKTKKSVVTLLMTEAMQECRGSVNPGLMRDAIVEELEERSSK